MRKPPTKFLSKVFQSVALAALSVFPVGGCLQQELDEQEQKEEQMHDIILMTMLATKGRNLTSGESALLSPFGVHTGLVGIKQDTNYQSGIAAIAEGTLFLYRKKLPVPITSITAFGDRYHSMDYSQELSKTNYTQIFNYGLFVHEGIHTWQIQNFLQLAPCPTVNVYGNEDMREAYRYTLTSDSHFMSFCKEQQARIVENYVKRFWHPSRKRSIGDPTRLYRYDNDEDLKRVVEEQFPNARIVREHIEQQLSSYLSNYQTTQEEPQESTKKVDLPTHLHY